jgi:hypothetical protein
MPPDLLERTREDGEEVADDVWGKGAGSPAGSPPVRPHVRGGLVAKTAPRSPVADLDDAVGAAFGVDHDVGEERVVARLGERQLDEPSWAGASTSVWLPPSPRRSR